VTVTEDPASADEVDLDALSEAEIDQLLGDDMQDHPSHPVLETRT